MNNLELINKLYKPYRITKLSKCTIIDSSDGRFVCKPCEEKNLRDLFLYLKGRNFTEFPNIVDDSRSGMYIFEYLDGYSYPLEQKGLDLIKLLASLHEKTSYMREVREDKYKEIFENLKNNLSYYKYQYEKMCNDIEEEIFMSPSHYLFIRNYSKLVNQLKFCENKLNDWYSEVKDKREIRVCTVHNNISLDHYIKGDREALISWEKSTVDSPILDIYSLYQKEWMNLEFKSILSSYLKYYPLNKDELDLLLIMLCMPKDIVFLPNEFKSCENVESILDYVFKTEELVKPYYLKEDKV